MGACCSKVGTYFVKKDEAATSGKGPEATPKLNKLEKKSSFADKGPNAGGDFTSETVRVEDAPNGNVSNDGKCKVAILIEEEAVRSGSDPQSDAKVEPAAGPEETVTTSTSTNSVELINGAVVDRVTFKSSTTVSEPGRIKVVEETSTRTFTSSVTTTSEEIHFVKDGSNVEVRPIEENYSTISLRGSDYSNSSDEDEKGPRENVQLETRDWEVDPGLEMAKIGDVPVVKGDEVIITKGDDTEVPVKDGSMKEDSSSSSSSSEDDSKSEKEKLGTLGIKDEQLTESRVTDADAKAKLPDEDVTRQAEEKNEHKFQKKDAEYSSSSDKEEQILQLETGAKTTEEESAETAVSKSEAVPSGSDLGTVISGCSGSDTDPLAETKSSYRRDTPDLDDIVVVLDKDQCLASPPDHAPESAAPFEVVLSKGDGVQAVPEEDGSDIETILGDEESRSTRAGQEDAGVAAVPPLPQASSTRMPCPEDEENVQKDPPSEDKDVGQIEPSRDNGRSRSASKSSSSSSASSSSSSDKSQRERDHEK